MKIVFVNNYFYIRGGSERVFFDEMELLKKYGYEVYPFSIKHLQNFKSEYDKFFPSELNYDNVSLKEKVKSAFNLIYSFEAEKKFYEFLSVVKPDLIHGHNIYGRLTTSIIDVAKTLSLPFIMTIHDYKLVCPSYLMLNDKSICERCLDGKYFNCFVTKCHKESYIASFIYTFESYFNKILRKFDWVDYFICPSKFSLKKHLEAGIHEKKLVHIPNFINVNDVKPNFMPGDYVLYVGRLAKEKGIITLLKAIQGLDIKLKVVGDGPVRADCERFVFENKINNVEFLGYKSGEELEKLYMQSAFLVMPSEWYENAPMTIIECFSYGKPMIGSNIGGIPEMIIDGETGFLFEPGNWQELQDKIKYVLRNPSLIENMGKKARVRAEKEYSAEVHYNRLMELYRKVL